MFGSFPLPSFFSSLDDYEIQNPQMLNFSAGHNLPAATFFRQKKIISVLYVSIFYLVCLLFD